MNRQKSFAVLLCAAALVACDYEKNAVQDITAPDPGSRIRFFNFGVIPTGLCTTTPPASICGGVNFYADDTKVTGISSTSGTEAVTGTGYGGVGLAGLYSALAPGQYTLTGRIAATTDKDLSVSTVATTLANGAYYSFYQSGFYDAATKTVEAFVVEDQIPATIDYSVAHVRFVHAISNANPMTLYASNATTAETAIGGQVAYKAGGTFTPIPGGTYNMATRYGGVTTNALTRTGVVFVAGRVYTITARGDITVPATTTGCAAANRTCLDNTANR